MYHNESIDALTATMTELFHNPFIKVYAIKYIMVIIFNCIFMKLFNYYKDRFWKVLKRLKGKFVRK